MFLEGRLVEVVSLSRKGTFRIKIKNAEGDHFLFRRSNGADGERQKLLSSASAVQNKRASVRYQNATLPWADNLWDYAMQTLRLTFKPYREIPRDYLEIIEINPISESP